ncbi:hypothetical protein D9619_000021 [Psilocybe cf. subviscida]|uniref:Uncharacterized protein n=1 Tax=Psilocybe cf. subviscida TaxID=2480587 RepID=A0A8H5F1Y4_9AGAR|nr:hypothetical protein D9619_000021 [Psilocybe cf. subviscida]
MRRCMPILSAHSLLPMPHSQMCTTAGNDAGMDDDILSDIVPPRVGRRRSESREGRLATKRMEMAKAKIADAVRRWSYLLGQTGPFEHSTHKARLLPRICRAHVRRAAKPKGREHEKAILYAPLAASSDNNARHRKSTEQGNEDPLKDGEAGLASGDLPVVYSSARAVAVVHISADLFYRAGLRCISLLVTLRTIELRLVPLVCLRITRPLSPGRPFAGAVPASCYSQRLNTHTNTNMRGPTNEIKASVVKIIYHGEIPGNGYPDERDERHSCGSDPA